MATETSPSGVPVAQGGCPPHVMQAIYGTYNKKEANEESLRRWWAEYADRKNDETDEYVANSLLYDRNHLPRSAPAPDCVARPGVLASVAVDVIPPVAALLQPVSEVGLQTSKDLEPQLPAAAAVLVPSKRALDQE